MKIYQGAFAALLLSSTCALAQNGPVFVLDEIVFSANAVETEAERAGFSVEVITEDDLAEAGDLQLTDYLERLPGITLSQSGPMGTSADIRIRGARSRYVSVYVDGILVTDPSGITMSYDDFGGLTTGGIRRIEILRGSQSALYGGTAVAGVINITTMAGEDTPMGVSQTAQAEVGSFNTRSASYGLTQRGENLTLSLGLAHAVSDGFSAADENDGNTEADGFDRSSLTFGAEYAVNSYLTLGVNGFAEHGSAEFDDFPPPFYTLADGTPDEEQERDATGLRAFGRYAMGAWEHELSISHYGIRRRSSSNGTASVFEGTRLAADYSASGQVSDTVLLSFGLSGQDETATYSNLPGGSAVVQTRGLFAEAVWSPSAALDITGTLRHDDHSAFGGQATGRLAFAWRPADGTVVRGAVSTGYRPPSLDELYGDYAAFDFFGNPDLTPEESFSAELGVDHQFSGGATLSATVFLLEVENLVTYQDCPRSPPFYLCDFATFSTLVNTAGTSTRQGLELSASVPLSDRITLNGAYTYTDAESATGLPLDRVPEHDVVLGLDALVGAHGRAGVSLHHVAGSFETGTPLGDYTVVDASYSHEIRDGIEAYFRIENLFDAQYQTVRGYGTADRSFYAGVRASF